MSKKFKNLSSQDIDDVSTCVEEFTEKRNCYGIKLQDIQIKIKCLNEKQKDLKKAIEEKDIVISKGVAGTGKTYLSLITALHLMKTQPIYSKLVLIKSLQTIKGEEVGTLPGTLQEKLNPYMNSFTSNLDKIFGSRFITKTLIDSDVIQIIPIAYIRGITFDQSIIICDETQNINLNTFKTVITRIGVNCKMIFLGDADQCDFIEKDKNKSCLSKVFDLFKEEEYVKCIEFVEEDCVRNPLIPKILKKLDSI